MIMHLRPAETTDLESVLAIAERRRRLYAGYQSRFWNPAADAVTQQREFFGSLLDDADTLFVAAEIDDHVRGFVIARVVATPPVYDPGGATCLVDDFAVDDHELWPDVGPALLSNVRAWAAGRGAVQLVVVTAAADRAKRDALAAAELDLASEWWVGPV